MVDEVLDLGLVPLEEFHQRVHDVLPKSNRFGVDGFTRELQELGRLVRLKAQKLCFPNSTEMAKKNRYADVLPYADSRVILNSCEDDPIKQYINASHVKLSLNGHICQYITTQAPIPNTFNDFWRMIWDTNSQLIVMLTKSQESNRIKADQYWPDQIDEKIATKDFAIVMKKYQVQGDIIIRQLNLIQSEVKT